MIKHMKRKMNIFPYRQTNIFQFRNNILRLKKRQKKPDGTWQTEVKYFARKKSIQVFFYQQQLPTS